MPPSPEYADRPALSDEDLAALGDRLVDEGHAIEAAEDQGSPMSRSHQSDVLECLREVNRRDRAWRRSGS